MLLFIPAIDLKAGKCVRLTQGKMKKMTVFSHEPVSMARLWQMKGAKLLHIIDLEGAVAGTPCNLNVVTKIIKAIDIPVQFGGGIRNMLTIKKILSKGISRVILGTAIYNNINLLKEVCDKFKEKIVVGIDSYDGKIATEGWNKIEEKDALIFAKEVEEIGVKTIIYTDIKKDGMLKGPNFEGIKEFAEGIKIDLIVSGGISSLEDVKKIKRMKLKYNNITGIIVGKAIYAGQIELGEAIGLVEI